VQNKVVKKYIDDYDVYLEGYAEGVANDAEAAAKRYAEDKIAQLLTEIEQATIQPLYE
jgi:hypothetical protein